MSLRVAIDIGGGFVDLVALDDQTGRTFWSKGQVTPADLGACVRNVFQLSGVDPEQVTQLLHGQTLVINAILQRRGAKVGLITTKGFRDILALQRSNRRDIFNLRYKMPEPFVPRERRVEIDERTAADGEVLREADRAALQSAFEELVRKGAESIAVCFLNSYRNPHNETRAKDLLRGFRNFVCVSSEVSREWREYERTSTCVLNAYVMPLMDEYLCRLRQDFGELGMTGTLYMMLSGGGVASFDYAAQKPIETVESGPAAGVVGAVKLAEIIGEQNIIALDGGSTTTKASLLEGLHPKFTTDYAIERDEHHPGYPIKVPVVDINEIGNGGGSVAWLDDLGHLRVGPLSAGASPGPACYGWGGEEPTLTDAFLVTGFLNPHHFLGGNLKIRPDLAERAMSRIAGHFAISAREAAFAIVRVGNNNAAQLLRLISIQRGFDPRDFTLLAYGGSGPLMAPYLAEELEIPKVVIPGIPPGNFSAWGLLMSDLRHSVVQTLLQRLDSSTAVAALNAACRDLESEILRIYRQEGLPDGMMLEQAADLRYAGQEHTISVAMASGAVTDKNLRELCARFHDQHAREYGFALPSAVELVNLRISGVVRVNKPAPAPYCSETASPAEALTSRRMVFWGDPGEVETPVFRRHRLPVGALLTGPAIIEESSTTIIVPHGFEAAADALGNLVLRRI